MGTFYHFFCPYNVRCPGFATSLPSVYRGRRLKCHSFPCPFYGVQFILPMVLFFALMKLEEHFPTFYAHLPRFVYSAGKLFLPIYLTHVGCGLTVMYWLSLTGCGPYLTLLGGVVASFAVAWLIYVCVTKPASIFMKKVIAKMRNKNTARIQA